MKTKTEWQKVERLLNNYVKEETIINKCTTAEQKNAVEKHFSRGRNKTPGTNSVKKGLDNGIKVRLQKIAKVLPDEGYSMGSMVDVHFAGLHGMDNRCKDYAKSCTWKPTHGRVEVWLTLDEVRNISVIGGLATYIYPNQRNKVKRCWWFDGEGSKNKFKLIRKHGYVYAGYHAETKNEALYGGGQSILREREFEKGRKLREQKEQKCKKNYARALRAQYSYEDSKMAGNCESGTRAFILRCKLDSTKKYRGSYLLQIANEKSSSSVYYVERMVKYRAMTM